MSSYCIGLDLGGTKIAAALVARDGKILFKVSEPTQAEQGVGPVIERMAGCVHRLFAKSDQPVAGIGVGAAGMTDSQNGVVILASNLKWRNVPVKRLLTEQLGAEWQARIWVDKDTNAAALGEMMYGAGRGARHLLYVTVGTGVGGGMVLDGRLYHGASQGASDLGHLVLEPDGPLCGCGKYGCLEALASGTAIARSAVEALQAGVVDTPLAALDMQTVSAQDVVDAALQGDAFSCKILEKAGYYLGRALAYYADINNPELIIIGGGVAAAGELLIEPARQSLQRFALPANAKTAQLLPAGLGPDSGVIGSAALAWQQVIDSQ